MWKQHVYFFLQLDIAIFTFDWNKLSMARVKLAKIQSWLRKIGLPSIIRSCSLWFGVVCSRPEFLGIGVIRSCPMSFRVVRSCTKSSEAVRSRPESSVISIYWDYFLRCATPFAPISRTDTWLGNLRRNICSLLEDWFYLPNPYQAYEARERASVTYMCLRKRLRISIGNSTTSTNPLAHNRTSPG